MPRGMNHTSLRWPQPKRRRRRTTRRLLIGLALAFAGPLLTAQSPPPSCTLTGGAPTVRAEGLSELVGDVVLTCTGGTPTASGAPIPTISLIIALNTNVTSRILAGNLTEAFLLIDEPSNSSPQLVCGTGNTVESALGVCTGITGTGTGLGVYSGTGVRANIFQGQVNVNAANQLSWVRVPFDPPGPSQTRILRFTNLRANAAQLGLSSTFTSSTITASVTVSGNTTMTISNPTTTVAFLTSGMLFTQGTANNSTGLSAPILVPNCTQGPTRIATLRFKEGFPSAFRPRTAAPFVDANTSPQPISQNTPGSAYQSESGFLNVGLPSDPLHGNLGAAGLADYGTRLEAQFSNIPPGVLIWVDPVNLGTSTTLTARLVSSESGAFSASQPQAPPNPPLGMLQVVGGNATARAVWEVLGANSNTLDDFDFGVYVQITSSMATANVAVSGNLGAVGAPSSITSIPLFQNVLSPTSLFSLNAGGSCGVLNPSPASLTFSFSAGAETSGAQSVQIQASSGSNLNTTVISYTSSGGNWLTPTLSSATTPGGVTVSANPSGLAVGSYAGELLISALGASNSLVVAVNMTISPIQGITITQNNLGAMPNQTYLTVTFPQSAQSTYTGQLSASFALDSGVTNFSAGVDPAGGFPGTGQSTTCPASGNLVQAISMNPGETQARIGSPTQGGSSMIPFGLGTVAGTWTVTLTNLTAGGVSALPSSLPSSKITIPLTALSILEGSVKIVNATSNGFSVQLNGFAASRDVSMANFAFPAKKGYQLNGNATASVPVSFNGLDQRQWFNTTASQCYGGTFGLTVPFVYSGDPNALGSVTVTLTNSKGTSATVSGGGG